MIIDGAVIAVSWGKNNISVSRKGDTGQCEWTLERYQWGGCDPAVRATTRVILVQISAERRTHAPGQSILIWGADQITTLHSHQPSSQSLNNISTCYYLSLNTQTPVYTAVFDVSPRPNHKQNILVWIIWVQFSLEMARVGEVTPTLACCGSSVSVSQSGVILQYLS